MNKWNIDKARALYNVREWSDGYFDVATNGHLVAQPFRNPERGQVDLADLVTELTQAGLNLPVLVRFNDILADRVDRLCSAFAAAQQRHGYAGNYTAVYPIKVNQQRTVVEEILRCGGDQVGLEAGSKPELMAVLAMSPPGGLIICNGYKDREYLRRALIGRRLGHRVFIVLEKPAEIEAVIAESQALGIRPLLGVRSRLASLGSGNWQNTGGEKSKFGLSAAQLLTAVDTLRDADMLDCLQLLHFHMGSQLGNIRDIQHGMGEAGRYFAELCKLGAPLHYLDVGGGLGVDYDGTRSRGPCSMNYSPEEYANTIVRSIHDMCVAASLPEPNLITEAGRAMTAHHAVLLTQVTDMEAPHAGDARQPNAAAPSIIHDLWQGLEDIGKRSLVEIYHEAAHLLTEAQGMFNHGVLDLAARAQAEQIYTAICLKLRDQLDPARPAHQEVRAHLDQKLAAKYFCNFSVFQSMPDVWALEQIFPVMPVHRLDEAPQQQGLIQDLTCDSDGRIDHYVDGNGVCDTLPLHIPRPGETYVLGFFLLGAYQEILGDIHNLFGDTDAVNVRLNADGSHSLQEPERGDTADQLLAYVHFEPERLLASYRHKVAEANLNKAEASSYLAELTAGLQGYTYLKT